MKKQQYYKSIISVLVSLVVCTQILMANGYTLPKLLDWEFDYQSPLSHWVDYEDFDVKEPDASELPPQYLDEQDTTAQKDQRIILDDPNNIVKDVTYDPETKQYILTERVAGKDIKPPVYMTSEEYLNYRGQEDESNYFRQRFQALTMFDQKPKLPEMPREGLFDRLFGSNKISIKPQGNMELMFGYRYQKLKNPQIAERTQKQGHFDFDMNMNVNLIAEVGDKLKLNINNKTNPSFGETNRQKIEFTGKEDEILKKIELGNTSFQLNSSLISGVKSLYGVKTQLQFGKLWVTGALSQQRSQRKSISIQGGGLMNEFNINADNYDENRNFLLGQYFYNSYEKALAQYPLINSQVLINKIEVWVTNRTGVTQNVRDIASFMDLGEVNPYLGMLRGGNQTDLPSNGSNQLYQLLQQRQSARNQSTATQTLIALGLQEGQDFQRSTMRQLNASEFTFNPKLGYISLNTQVNADDVIAVAYRYTYNGQVYQVGEFAEEVPPEDQNAKVMYMKLLKGTSARPQLPIWNLMMKNIYSLGSTNISAEKFSLNVLYLDPGGGRKRYLPEGPYEGEPLIRLLNLDRLNPQGDPYPDGIFDFVDGITVNTQSGKIIFPVLEPFAEGLKYALGGNQQLERKYLYNQLYDSTKTIAKQFAQYNRFILNGKFKGRSGNDVSLGGFNIPEGSVTVNAGGQLLTEGTDYTVDYAMGRIRITNEGIMQSGVPINVSFEDNTTFSLMQQNFMGLRADYYANPKLILGGTLMRLTERPYTTNMAYGEDPIRNTVGGLDVNYQSESKMITRILDKLPIYSTTTPSMVSLRGEVAGLFPGHSNFLNALDPEGSTFIDNFEGANTSIDLRTPLQAWNLSSVPVGIKNANGVNLFPGGTSGNDLSSGYDRAKIAWYNIDQRLIEGTFNTPENIKEDTVAESYWRQVYTEDVFPDKEVNTGMNMLTTFDISYFPKERGPYNFTTTNVDNNGLFTNPQDKFGGLQRALDNNNSDFEQSNVEYITFWVQDPFIYNTNTTGGDLYINLGSVSEDVLKDGRMAFENGIPYPKDNTKLQETNWGYVPSFSQQITRAFENDPAARAVQDVGYDALDDDEERLKFSNFLGVMQGLLGPNSEAYQKLLNDPSSDNFMHFRNALHDDNKHGVITRYKNINNPHGNTPIADNSEFANAIKNTPESEDINNDNTLNEQESYYAYRIPMMPATHPSMQVGQNNIVSVRKTTVKLKSGRDQEETWYQYKIPIRAYTQAVGGISDFRSIRFFRMFLTGFQDSVTMRFAELQLDRNLWRTYQYSLKNPGEFIPLDQQQRTKFALNTVGIEQNSSKEPVNYQSPPGVQRQRMISGISNQQLRQNEQSLSLEICGLKDGDSRAAFSERSLDLRQYDYLRAFVHAASVPGQAPLRDDDLYLFVRVGSDFISNYYEYRLPLKITQPGEKNIDMVWPEANRINLKVQDLVNAKLARNDANIPSFFPYTTTDEKGNAIVVIGNPNLGDVRNVMIGVSNPSKADNMFDDGLDKCAEIWVDELRVAGFDEQAGYAGAVQANIQLADLGSINFSGSYSTIGYGSINQKVNQRSREELYAYNINTNLNLGKLMPKTWNVLLPAYVGYTENVSNPEYDPYDLDIKLKDKVRRSEGSTRDSVLRAAQTMTNTTSFNLSNIKINGNPEKQGKPKPWQLRNFDASYAYNRIYNRNPFLESDEYVDQRIGLGYAYTFNNKPWEPFKKRIKSKNKWLLPIKDFNINPLPKTFTFRNNIHKVFGETIVRNLEAGERGIDPTYYKNFIWDRTYALTWDLTKALKFNYSGNNMSRVDEPYGRIDNQQKKDSLWSNILGFGRNTFYSQDFRATYDVPTKKIPALDWTTATLTYGSTYSWTGAPMVAYNLGHTIANTQTKQLNIGMNFTQMYNKSRHLKVINYPNPNRQQKRDEEEKKKGDSNKDNLVMQSVSAPRMNMGGNAKFGEVPPKPEIKEVPKSAVKGGDTLSPEAFTRAWDSLKKIEKKRHKKEVVAWRAKRKNILPETSDFGRAGIRLATIVKNSNITYSEKSGTVLPGFTDSSYLFGSSMRNPYKWYDFVFGGQPDQRWIDSRVFQQQFSKDSMFNQEMKQEFARNLNMTATLEPITNFRIDLNIEQNFSRYYKSLHKYNEATNSFEYLSPYTNGMYTASFIGISSFFKGTMDNYNQFIENRYDVSRRLGETNPYVNGVNDPSDPNFKKGYTGYSQDVIIPSFLATYMGKSGRDIPLMVNNNNSVKQNPFKNYLPMPNWRINYNGLAKTPLFSEKFSVINIRHSYRGMLSMNSFGSNLMYQDLLGVGFPSFLDSTSGNFIPFFQIPNVTITENFGPIAGFDFTMKSGFSFKFEYNSNRMLSLSLVDYQISETKSKEFRIGFGHRLKGMNLPFKIFGVDRLENDVNIKVDFGLRDDITRNMYFALSRNEPTRGQKVITFSPVVDYNINENFQIRVFADYRKASPYVTSSFPVTNLNAGFKLIYMFSPN